MNAQNGSAFGAWGRALLVAAVLSFLVAALMPSGRRMTQDVSGVQASGLYALAHFASALAAMFGAAHHFAWRVESWWARFGGAYAVGIAVSWSLLAGDSFYWYPHFEPLALLAVVSGLRAGRGRRLRERGEPTWVT